MSKEKTDPIFSTIPGEKQTKFSFSNSAAHQRTQNTDTSHMQEADIKLGQDEHGMKKMEGFTSIESAISLHPSLILFIHGSKKILLKGEKNLLRTFLDNIESFNNLTHLVIHVDEFNPHFVKSIKNLICKGLIHLEIHCKNLYRPLDTAQDFNFYSDLKILIITSKSYGFEKYSGIEGQLNDLCCKIIKRNADITQFCSTKLIEIQKRLEELKIKKGTKLIELNNEQIKYILEITYQHRDFIDSLNRMPTLSQYPEKSVPYELIGIIQDLFIECDIRNYVNDIDIENFRKLLTFVPDMEINKHLSNPNQMPDSLTFSDYKFVRLIDMAVQNNAIEIIKLLISRNADLTYAVDDISMADSQRFNKLLLNRFLSNNFPFKVAIQRNGAIKKLFLSDESVLYDGVAWLIWANDIKTIKEILTTVKLDLNKIISLGFYKGFTVMQLLIYFDRSSIYLDILVEDDNKTLSEIAEQVYPNIPSFTYASSSILSVIIHEARHDELVLFSKNINILKVFFKNNQVEPIAILFDGIHNISKFTPIYEEMYEHVLIRIEKCLECLLKHSKNKLDDLQSIKLYDPKEKQELPLLHFAVNNNIFLALREYTGHITNYLQQKCVIRHINCEVNLLQLSAIKEEPRSLEILFRLYEKCDLLTVLSEPFYIEKLNLFQFSIVEHRYDLFKLITTCNKLPINLINLTFPETHKDYPGWLPIQVVIIKCFTTLDREFLTGLLNKTDLDIITPFKEEGLAHHLKFYYPLSAIFFPGNPIKNDSFNSSPMSAYLQHFLPHISRISSNKIKKEILNQALFWAVYHHNIINGYHGYDHREHIKTLLRVGANPNQNVLGGRMRIIELAQERGLLDLFPEYLDKINISSENKILAEHYRQSELNAFSPGQTLHIEEDHCSVVSLVRNKQSISTQHAFLIVEQIVDGRSKMHFIDFVQEKSSNNGKIRHETYEGKITDTLLFSCKRQLMKIQDKDLEEENLSCQSWIITNWACTQLFDALEKDKKGAIKYLIVGNRNLCARSSNKQGHNCYTWARKILFATEDNKIKAALPETFEELLGTVPFVKERVCRPLLGAANAVIKLRKVPLILFTYAKAALSSHNSPAPAPAPAAAASHRPAAAAASASVLDATQAGDKRKGPEDSEQPVKKLKIKPS